MVQYHPSPALPQEMHKFLFRYTSEDLQAEELVYAGELHLHIVKTMILEKVVMWAEYGGLTHTPITSLWRSPAKNDFRS